MLELREERSPFLSEGLRGVACVRRLYKTFPRAPGVYRMVNDKGEALYVGKARSLRERLASYARGYGHNQRVMTMISKIANIEVITTRNEAEALLLECNLIKKMRPPFNILLRDDKSFPYIGLGHSGQTFAQVFLHRGAQRKGGVYYGPFPTSAAARETVHILERGFLLRSCSDTVFAQRQRPCLLYQIKRCSAPCVGRIGEKDYAQLIDEAQAFLRGQSDHLREKLADAMERASQQQDYERAARYRDRLKALAKVQAHQQVDARHMGDCDVIALWQQRASSCVQVFFFRHGRVLGNHAYYPRHDTKATAQQILAAVIGQFYVARPAPRQLLLSHPLADKDKHVLEQALSEKNNHTVTIAGTHRGKKRAVMDYVLDNARQALHAHRQRNQDVGQAHRFLQELFALPDMPERIEVYDNSHTSGGQPVGVMVVADQQDFITSAYRQFRIGKHDGRDTAEPYRTEDDYGMMREVIYRRFSRALAQDESGGGGGGVVLPDLLIIDGGKGQLNAVLAVLGELGLEGMPVLAMAKGKERKAGKETLYLPDGRSLMLLEHDAVSHYMQRLRDEAHRFAIMTHRKKRAKTMTRSRLDSIQGIGAARKRALLRYFGSVDAIKDASIDDLKKVEGISDSRAQMIYDDFHESPTNLAESKSAAP